MRPRANAPWLGALEESGARIDKIVIFQGVEKHEDLLEEMLNGCEDEDLQRILETNNVPEDPDDLISLIDQKLTGYIFAEVHTPFSMSKANKWGHTTYSVVIGRNMGEAIYNACMWARRVREKNRMDSQKIYGEPVEEGAK